MHRKEVEDLPEFVALKAAATYFEMVIARVSNMHNVTTSVIPKCAYEDIVTLVMAGEHEVDQSDWDVLRVEENG